MLWELIRELSTIARLSFCQDTPIQTAALSGWPLREPSGSRF